MGDLLYSADGREWRQRRLATTTLEGLAVGSGGTIVSGTPAG